MTYKEFIAIITKEQPSLEDFAAVVLFLQGAKGETVWQPLQVKGVHQIFVALLAKILQEKIVAEKTRLAMKSIVEKFRAGTGKPKL